MIDKNDILAVGDELRNAEATGDLTALHDMLWRMVFKYRKYTDLNDADYATLSGGDNKPPPNSQ